MYDTYVKVFMSQPMHGLTSEEIFKERKRVMSKLLGQFSFLNLWTTAVVNDIEHDDAPPDAGRLWYLGNAIQKMDGCQIYVFAKGWKEANGRLIERAVYDRYLRGGNNILLDEEIEGVYFLGPDILAALGCDEHTIRRRIGYYYF